MAPSVGARVKNIEQSIENEVRLAKFALWRTSFSHVAVQNVFFLSTAIAQVANSRSSIF